MCSNILCNNDSDGNIYGNIFNIQRFTVHDGPGIRTELFFKGCPLRCIWCSNPEGLSKKQEVGVFGVRCIGIDKCGYCLKACPEDGNNFFVAENGWVKGINRNSCSGCLRCADVCPSNNLRVWGKEMTLKEVMKVILSDMEFYKKSGGGVTFSGGEALNQWKFVLEVMRECKKQNIHTCVESSLYCEKEILERLYPYLDLLITDIKHMDSDAHRLYTGVGNERILGNIKTAIAMDTDLIIRIPIIPDHNDSEENIRLTATFIKKELNNQVKQVQLLRFRKLGEEKYNTLGMAYPMLEFVEPEREMFEKRIEGFAKILRENGIPAIAGTTTIL